MFYFDHIEGKKILKSDYIKGAEAFFTTRDLCICDKSEKENQHPVVGDNRILVANYLNIDENKLISPIQTHSKNIDIVNPTKYNYPDCDGLILAQKEIAIYLNFADCTPIIFWDEKNNVIAVSHAGWRGSAERISVLTLEKMNEFFGSNPRDIIVLIGPAIGFCCYDVGEDVYHKLSKTVNNFDGLYEIREGKIFVDLKNINKQQLLESGVEKIDVCPYCTVHNNDLFYSYRNETKTTLRHSAVVKL